MLLDGARLASAVSGTVGVERHLITFLGQAAHAGSTPMRLRQDSLAAAARASLAIRESAIAHNGVATVGRMHSTPGVITAVAGRTEMQLDQRHLDPGELAAMLAEALEACRSGAEEFNCTVEVRNVFSVPPTPFDPALVEMARVSVEQAGGGAHEPIPSGPLHDATEIGRVVPTAMIFAQSDPPISHAAIEDSSERGAQRRDRRVRADRESGAGKSRRNHVTGSGVDHELRSRLADRSPATRDWTVTVSLFATLNEMYGNRTICGIGRGDSKSVSAQCRPLARTPRAPRAYSSPVR